MFSSQKETDMIECPYNKAHRMLRKRLQAHLLKCRLSYPDVELQKCPFNQTHLIPEPEFVHHVTNCSDRKLITQYKYDAPDGIKEEEEERVKQEPIQCDENWDDDEVEDYDPKKYLATSTVLRKLDGGLPSERKAFIKQERKRLGDYNSSDEEEERTKKQKKQDIDRRNSSDEEAEYAYAYSLRRPMTPPAPKNVAWFEETEGWQHLRHTERQTSPSGSRRHISHARDEPSSSRHSHSRRHSSRPPVEADDYELDDDPYYNGGGAAERSEHSSYRSYQGPMRGRY